MIYSEILIHSLGQDSVEVQPRGQGCYTGFASPVPDHEFFVTAKAAGFKYAICGRCGTVRIEENHEQGPHLADPQS